MIQNYLLIGDVATHPDYQKQGYAKEMLIYLLNQAKNANYNYAGLVATFNSLLAYQKFGFIDQQLYFNVYTMH